jgi:ubiquinone/menaquinone biosynthesis C-methylase UbiE
LQTPNPDYEYRGLMAAYWDLLRGDTSQWSDRFFFLELIPTSGQPVLDVGCGTGRLLLDFMEQGMDIDGVDNSPEMLELCRAKAEKLGLRPNLYLQAMEALDLPRRYRTIMVPSLSLQLILVPADVSAAMSRFYAHLEPGGTLATPLRILWTGEDDHPVAPEDWHLLVEKDDPEKGVKVQRWIRNRYDLDAQLEHTEDRYDLVCDGEVIASEYHSRSPATRWYTQEQAVALYRDAGFKDIRVLRGNTFEPAAPSDTFFTITGVR